MKRLIPLLLLAGCYPTTYTPPPPSSHVGVNPPPAPDACPTPAPRENHAAPLAGGTLLVTSDQRTAIVADPDRDRLIVVDLDRGAPRAIFPLPPGAEPGRAAEDGAGRAHVILRGGGAVVTVDYRAGALVDQRPVCPAPRGIAYDPWRDLLRVACAGGELVTLPAAGGPATLTQYLDRDLRDILVQGDQILVSRFRSAELLTLDVTGALLSRSRPDAFSSVEVRRGATFDPAVAWRTLARPSGGVLMIHQRGQNEAIAIAQPNAPSPPDQPVPYGPDRALRSECKSGIVHSALTRFADGQPRGTAPALPGAVLPIDAAINGTAILLVAAGNADAKLPQLFWFLDVPVGDCTTPQTIALPFGRAIAVAPFRDRFLVQTRDPSALVVAGTRETIDLGGDAVGDLGYDLFHTNSGNGLACASCHPEGGEDGRVWHFNIGPRRTQSLRGGVAGTAPFHWGGDMKNLPTLFDEVFTHRMGGHPLSCDEQGALAGFLETIPLLPASPPRDPDAVVRGRALFYDATGTGAACAVCHSGEKLTNNATASVGTGEPFQVPSLRGVAFRGPFLHDGCASTLTNRFDRFGPCGGGAAHGNASHLSDSQIADLVAFLETL